MPGAFASRAHSQQLPVVEHLAELLIVIGVRFKARFSSLVVQLAIAKQLLSMETAPQDATRPTQSHLVTFSETRRNSIPFIPKFQGGVEGRKPEEKAKVGLFHVDDTAHNHDNMAEKPYDVRDFYKEPPTRAVRLCTNPKFENTTFAVIGINALYLGFDSDNNLADLISEAHVFFQICENLFAMYFTFELAVRFQAFEKKCNCCRDFWFIFDTILVSLMIFETWLLPTAFSGATLPFNIQFLRLLRLLRLARMVRLLRNLPELLALVKATGAAIRSAERYL